ncbi:MAG: bis(5'-nucleosyl)-tetraphosphatase (symmetrical) YqeK [Acidaminococcales bacterium]|nr:bis(5'-nucleosyl)-tetraphosphatase (symmetrical) YqeK [Acidaminococcales bacterium]
MKIQEIDALLKTSLPPKRYEHSVSVMCEAAVLAEHHNLDPEKIRIAALLHDCGRESANHEAPRKAREMGLSVSPIEEAQPVLLHARMGAAIAREKYRITDAEILKAISLHTTGGKNMSELDMVIFLADYTEPARVQKGVDKVRRLARANMDLAMLSALKYNMEYLLRSRRCIHPDCIDCWNYFLGKLCARDG